jgi:predicted DNA-binding ribbon-helix-helix protein
MWDALHDIARKKRCSVNDLVTEIDRTRGNHPLSTEIRNYIAEYYRETLRRALTDGKAGERG